jgi:hypothetical protein
MAEWKALVVPVTVAIGDRLHALRRSLAQGRRNRNLRGKLSSGKARPRPEKLALGRAEAAEANDRLVLIPARSLDNAEIVTQIKGRAEIPSGCRPRSCRSPFRSPVLYNVRFGVHLASKSPRRKSCVFIDRFPQVIDICCLGCKRSGVRIPPARPNSSKSYSQEITKTSLL